MLHSEKAVVVVDRCCIICSLTTHAPRIILHLIHQPAFSPLALDPHPRPSCQKVPFAVRKGRKKRDELIGEQLVSPPFPVPLVKERTDTTSSSTKAASSAAKVVWPLNQDRKQPFFLGKINHQDACIDILDPASVQCLYLYGFFGKGSRSKNAPIYKIKRKRELQLRNATQGANSLQRQSGPSDQLMVGPCSTREGNNTRRSPVRTRHGPKKKQWNSLQRAFGGPLPDKASLVKKLFPTQASLNGSNNNKQERSHATCSSSLSAAEESVGTIREQADDDEDDDASQSSTSSWESDAAAVDAVTHFANKKRMTTASAITESTNDNASCEHQEILKLGLEEAYFLSYGLGVLSIVHQNPDEPFLNLDQLWSTYRRLFNPSDLMQFPVIYAAYHYFRSRGWVVKCGLKFACDFLLYKEGPPFNHSEHAVTVVRVRESDDGKGVGELTPAIDWQHVTAMQRMSQGVRKKAILCHVMIGSDVTEEDFALVSVIQKFKIHCSLVQRWKARQGDTDDCSE